MNILPRRLLPGLLAVVLSLPAAAFEGKVFFDMTSGRDTVPIVYSLKGERARFEMLNLPDGTGTLIFDGEKQKGFVLMPEQKMYFSLSYADAAEVSEKYNKASSATFEDTGETEEILGRKCRKYRIIEKDGTTEISATEGMGKFAAQLGGNPMKRDKSVPAWQKELMAKGYFPLRMVTRNKKGKETMRMQATKIEETSLADSLFTVPADFQEFSMSGLMRGLIPGGK